MPRARCWRSGHEQEWDFPLGWWKYSKMDCGGGCITLNILKTIESHPFDMCTLCYAIYTLMKLCIYLNISCSSLIVSHIGWAGVGKQQYPSATERPVLYLGTAVARISLILTSLFYASFVQWGGKIRILDQMT